MDEQQSWYFSREHPQLDQLAEKKIALIDAVAYGSADGLNTRECNGGFQPAGWRSHDGRLWFPTMKGVATVDPKRASVPEAAPPIMLEGAIFDHHVVNPQEPEVRMPPGRGDLEISYSAPSFNAPEKTSFKYLLEGFDRTWVDAGTRRTAYYTKVPPGTYKFRVIASIGGGPWGSTKRPLLITLEAHFYQTVWFYVGCPVALIALAIFGTRLYLKYLAERRRLLEALVYRKAKDLTKEIRERELVESELLTQKAALQESNRTRQQVLSMVDDVPRQ